MAEIRVPTLGESVTEATIGKWFKKPGDAVAVDEPLVELETDKVTIEVPAPAAGVLGEIAAKDGETVAVGALLGQIKDGAAPRRKAAAPPARAAKPAERAEAARQPQPQPQPPARPTRRSPPSVRKLAAESGMDASTVPGSGKDGRVTKGDMLAAIERAAAQPTPVAAACRRRAGARAVAGRRRRARRAREDDAAAPDHRAPPQGRAEHRRHADDLQRGRHERGDGAAQPVQGPVREEARREARLHGLLRARLRAGAEGNPRRQRRDRRRRPRSTRTTTTSASRSAPRRAWWCRWCATATRIARRDREGDRRFRPPRARRRAQDRGDAGRHLHHLQRRRLRLADVDADPQRAAVRHPRHAQDPGAAGGDRRQDRDRGR